MGGCYGGGMPMASCGGYESGYGFDGSMGYPMMGGMAPMMTGVPSQMMPNGQAPMVAAPQTNEFSTVPQTAAPFAQGPMPQPYQQQTPPNKATVIVSLPADAKLFVDGEPMNLTGAVRQFRTPELQAGVKYAYTLRIEMERNGKPVTDTRTENLEPGKTTQVHFAEPGTPGAARS